MASHVRLIALFSLLTLVAGCKTGDRAERAPKPSASGAMTLTAKPNVKPQLLTRMRELTVRCEVQLESASVICPGRERQDFLAELAPLTGAERAATLGTMATALADPDPKLRLVAAGIAGEAFRSSLGDELKPGAVAVDDAKALLEVTAQLPEAQALQVTPVAVHGAMLAGLGDALYELLDRRSSLAPTAYRHLMTHGRLRAFPKIKQLGASQRLDLQQAALESVRTMQGWSEAERSEVCPWSQDIFLKGKAELRVIAGTLLVNCPGRAVDLLLSQSEAWHSEKTLSATTVLSLRGLCAEGSAARPTPAQCERWKQLFTALAADPSLNPQIRAAAQEGLKAQGPDNPKSSGP